MWSFGCLFLDRFWLKLQRWAWIWVNVGVIGMNKTWLFKRLFGRESEKKREEAVFSNRNLLCGHCGGWCVNRATNCVVFQPEVSFKPPQKREMYLSWAPLAASPWLNCSNVNGGFDDIGWDPLNPSPATAPSFSFPLRQLVSFKGSWPSDWCVIAPSLTCPRHSVIHRPGSQRCFLLTTLFPGLWVESLPPRFLSRSYFLFLLLSAINTLWLFIATVLLLRFTLIHSFLLTQFVKLQIAFFCIKLQLLMCNKFTIDI